MKYKTGDLPDKPNGEFVLPALTAGIQNQGLNNYVPLKGATVLNRVISISANGANTGATFFQKHNFTVLQDSYAIDVREELNYDLTDNQYIFIAGAISKTIYGNGNFEWTNKAGWEKVKDKIIQLPVVNNKIDFNFMNALVDEIQNIRLNNLKKYLLESNLYDYHLTDDEEKTLRDYSTKEWSKFNLEKLFGKSTRGRRLKSSDRIDGNLPFVTAGEAEEGVSDFIGNKVEVFENNTITIDMFGSAKYRNYKYGGDDHIAVVHTEKLDKCSALFVTSAIHKSAHNGQFNYGKNFYAKDADELFIELPIKEGKPDYAYMSTLISAIQKMIIKDVVVFVSNH